MTGPEDDEAFLDIQSSQTNQGFTLVECLTQ
jgi:hypothetical protein